MNDANKYIRRVRRCLPGSRRQTAWIGDQVRNSLGADVTRLSYAEIVDQLGTPEALAAAQIEAMPASEIVEKVQLQNWIKKVILAAVFTVIVLLTCLVIAEYVDARKTTRGKLCEEEEIIIISQDDDFNNK